MSKTRTILMVCLAIAAISAVVQVISAIINPQAVSIPVVVATGIVPVVLCIALIETKKEEVKK